MVKGELFGRHQKWSMDGKLREEDSVRATLSFQSGSAQNDKLKFLDQPRGRYGFWYDQRSGCLADGLYTKYFDDGTIEKEINFSAGKEHGYVKVWWPDGRLRVEKSLKDGLGHGLARGWHFNGRLARRRFFDNGCFLGAYETWSEKGHKTWERFWENGNLNEYEKGWDDDGNLIFLIYYHHGIKLFESYGFVSTD
jgi:antitoxin component YwqK of YwqJK toxin-antitoxin module